MEVRTISHWFRSAVAGSLLLAAPGVNAGDGCRGLCSEQPSRPHVSAADAPNWGFHQTCWQRFPPVAPCPPSVGDHCPWNHPEWHSVEGNSLQVPPSAMMLPAEVPHELFTDASPEALPGMTTGPGGFDSKPVSVLPHSPTSGRYGLPGPAVPVLPGATPGSGPVPPQPVPALVLPPLPAPPSGTGTPVLPANPDSSGIRTFYPPATGSGQAVRGRTPSALPDQLMFSGDGRIHAVHVRQASQSNRRPVESSRYGTMPGVPRQSPVMFASGSLRYGAVPPTPVRAATHQTPVRPRSAVTTGSRYGQ